MMSDIQLYEGDCLEVMAGLPDGCVSCVVTDPPYNQINRETGGLREIDKGGADSEPIDIDVLAKEFDRLATDSVVVFCADTQFTQWVNALSNLGMTTRIGVWHKTNPSPMNGDKLYLSAVELCVIARKPNATFNGHCLHPVWTGQSERVFNFPCPKPIWLMQSIVEILAPIEGTVLDPYLGSGTTGVATLRSKRKFIGIELNPSYFRLASRRIGVEEIAQSQTVMELI